MYIQHGNPQGSRRNMYQTVNEMYHNHGLRLKDIARELNTTVGKIRKIMKRHNIKMRRNDKKYKLSIDPSETLKAQNNCVSKGDSMYRNNAEHPMCNISDEVVYSSISGKTVYTQDDGIVRPTMKIVDFQPDQAVGRKLLLVDELPQGALARYERDVAAIAYIISRRGAVPDQIQEAEEILVPTWEIAANPQVRLSEIKARRLNNY